MRVFILFILFLVYFQAGIGTMVWYSDQNCTYSNRPNRCLAAAIGTGAIWPAYWSTLTWRAVLDGAYESGELSRPSPIPLPEKK